jgi:two-component system chemotaxis response regulator CheY
LSKFLDKKVLLVDDMKSVRILVEKTLIRFGFTKENISSVENGKIAFEKIQTEKFDLVITDINMEEMTGQELVEACRKIDSGKDLTFIMLTSDVDPKKMSDLMALGVQHYLIKPLDQVVLLTKINEIFP